MDSSLHNNSISFEIPVENVTNSPKVLPVIGSSRTHSFTEIDMNEKLKKADERRSRVLTDTRNKNEQHVKMVKSKCEQLKGEFTNQSHLRMESLNGDLEQKNMRRQIIMEERVNSAKKEVEKAKKLAEMRANAREDISRFTSDLMEKENNRKAYLQGIVQACQAEHEKVVKVRSRRSLMGNSTDMGTD